MEILLNQNLHKVVGGRNTFQANLKSNNNADKMMDKINVKCTKIVHCLNSPSTKRAQFVFHTDHN